jgi:transcriptional regulator with XRE-family HTH domain
MTMKNDERVEARWSVDLEATVAKNVCWLRENRGISRKQFGSDLLHHGFGMDEVTVLELESGEKPLRLNEIAVIAAYFEVPIQSLWRDDADIANEILAATEAAEEEQRRISAEYYTQQRVERLRNKLENG